MRRLLASLLLIGFLAVPTMGKCLKPFQPPSPKKMVKQPHCKPVAALLKHCHCK